MWERVLVKMLGTRPVVPLVNTMVSCMFLQSLFGSMFNQHDPIQLECYWLSIAESSHVHVLLMSLFLHISHSVAIGSSVVVTWQVSMKVFRSIGVSIDYPRAGEDPVGHAPGASTGRAACFCRREGGGVRFFPASAWWFCKAECLGGDGI